MSLKKNPFVSVGKCNLICICGCVPGPVMIVNQLKSQAASGTPVREGCAFGVASASPALHLAEASGWRRGRATGGQEVVITLESV